MLVHVFENDPHHYNQMVPFFKKTVTDAAEQLVWCRAPRGNEAGAELDDSDYRYYRDYKELSRWLKALPASARVVFHSLTDRHLTLALLNWKGIRNAMWVSWGADTYRYCDRRSDWRVSLGFILHRYLVKRMKKVIALNPGDAKLITSTFGCERVEVVPYPLLGVDSNLKRSRNDEQRHVLLGTSADKSNEHFELIDRASEIKSPSTQWIMPLNYGGNEDYINEVIQYGEAKLAGQFQPITEMLAKTKYDELLINIDGAVLAHKRQKGLYVAYFMLMSGKPLFVRDSTTTFKNFTDMEFVVSGLEQLSSISQCDGDARFAQNSQRFWSTFSEQALMPRWKQVLVA